MSIDLDWHQLSTLSNRLVDSLNRLLKSTERPSFIGPISITSFEFGSTPPDVELVDVRDIYPDFLEESDASGSESTGTDEEYDESQRSSHVDEPRRRGMSTRLERDEEFEWVNRRGTGRGVAEMGPTYHPFPPHMRYGGASSASNILDSTSPLVYSRSWDIPPFNATRDGEAATPPNAAPSLETAAPEVPMPMPKSVNTDNDLQFHLRVIYHSDIRINLSTSLLLNYPAPLFMALPIRLTIVGFEFDGEVVVAYQPSRKRMHLCVLDDEDPYRPATASSPRPNENEKSSVGARLLPHIFIESEIGQADKQVLRNVGRVEKFIQDMVRMTLEQELVFPNFQTVVYGEEE